MSGAEIVVARAEEIAAPRIAISVSRGSVTCGLTTLSVNVRFLIEADPLRPQNDPFASTRSYEMRGAANAVRTDWPPTCDAYASNTWNVGVATNRFSCARNSECRQLTSCA